MRDPIWFTLTRIELANALLYPFAKKLDVGHEQVVADELHLRAERVR